MRIAICDDEPEIRNDIERKIRLLYPETEILLYEDGRTLLDAEAPFDIVFLDIRMEGMNGMEAARALRAAGSDAVIIFVTALEEYVYEAFDVGAFHYLVKPLDRGKFYEVLSKAVTQCQNRRRECTNAVAGCRNAAAEHQNTGMNYGNTAAGRPNTGMNYRNTAAGRPNTGMNYGNTAAKRQNTGTNYRNTAAETARMEPGITVKTGAVTERIRLSEIYYLEVFNRKIILHKKNETVEFYGKMKEMEQRLGDDFMRTHRAYLVNLRYVRKYNAAEITLENGQTVLIAKQKYAQFVKQYMRYVRKATGGEEAADE